MMDMARKVPPISTLLQESSLSKPFFWVVLMFELRTSCLLRGALPFEPLGQSFLLLGIFELGSQELFAASHLISAFWVARITGVSHQRLATTLILGSFPKLSAASNYFYNLLYSCLTLLYLIYTWLTSKCLYLTCKSLRVFLYISCCSD
jgi:hypothetical protein